MFTFLLVLALITGLATLGILVYKTQGDGVQPTDTVPYLEIPGDLDNGSVLPGSWET